jgi:hypothetical protein
MPSISLANRATTPLLKLVSVIAGSVAPNDQRTGGSTRVLIRY